MDPRNPLLAVTQPSADEGAKRGQHPAERAAVAGEHHSEPQPHDPHPDGLGARGFVLPWPAHLGEEPRARRGGLVERLVAARAVVPDGRGADQDPWPRLRGAGGVDHGPRRLHTALEDRGLPRRRPPAAGDRLAGEVHDRVGGADRLRDGVPADGVAGDLARLATDDGHCVARPA